MVRAQPVPAERSWTHTHHRTAELTHLERGIVPVPVCTGTSPMQAVNLGTERRHSES